MGEARATISRFEFMSRCESHFVDGSTYNLIGEVFRTNFQRTEGWMVPDATHATVLTFTLTSPVEIRTLKLIVRVASCKIRRYSKNENTVWQKNLEKNMSLENAAYQVPFDARHKVFRYNIPKRNCSGRRENGCISSGCRQAHGLFLPLLRQSRCCWHFPQKQQCANGWLTQQGQSKPREPRQVWSEKSSW